MCVVCGCADPRPAQLQVAGDAAGGGGPHGGHAVAPHAVVHAADHTADHAAAAARVLTIEADVLGANDGFAARNRALFAERRVAAYNLVSSPGSGKTALLCATIRALRQRSPGRALAVIEGDQQTRLDADRIRAAGAPAVQVNTGHGCHLDARMVARAMEHLPLHGDDDAAALLFIENVGNLVCPALWDLGEHAKVAILSVTEGDDKPLKYPDMFAAASLMVINKLDLLPHVDFDLPRCIDFALRVNPRIEVLLTSATRGDGMDAWLDWLTQPRPVAPGQAGVPPPVAVAQVEGKGAR